MIPRVHQQGKRTIGLLIYLYGPGTHEEHTDPHLVASFDGLAPDPGRDPRATLRDLQRLLDQPLLAVDEHQRPAKHVWHCSVRAAADDRILSGEEWADIARRVVAATGIDPDGDDAGCRWAAVRHADDHIHIIATLIREDGHSPNHHRSGQRAQAACRLIEADYGLQRVEAGDGTAARRPTSAERRKAQRQGRERTARDELRETVRRAVAGATSESEFFDRLAAAGLLLRNRVAPSGDLLGYAVALPGDRNGKGEPIWFPGAKLAPDLSLPRIRERLATGDEGAALGSSEFTGTSGRAGAVSPADARRHAAEAAWDAIPRLYEGDNEGAAAAQIAAAGEVLDALAKTSAAVTRRDLREAAWVFERASRSHVRAQHHQARAVRRAARDLIYGGPALGRGEDGAATAMVIDTLIFLVIAAAHWHSEHQHAQQAAAARQAAEHLRTAYRAASATPMKSLRDRGRRLPDTMLARHAATIRQAVPELAEDLLAESGWPALAATLADAETSGRDAAALLTSAARRRELDSADSLSDVLVWRLRRLADLPAAAPSRPISDAGTPSAATRPAERPVRRARRRPAGGST
ncbi:relaxase/mobilization nuclease domain-containing protein [Streptomyces sp. NPDC001633]|uniref:relaxase/mobilization nuclease domain-containing protein n=1 Tax=Streptomyces sp. NPDC001633 TaxID=3364595 RepID=UPI0036B644C0